MPRVSADLILRLAACLDHVPLRAFFAGGIVRDLLLGAEPRDADLLIEAGEEGEAEALRALADLARMDPVVFDRRPPTTYRVVVGGVIVDASFCAPGGLVSALERRDFTINAMAIPIDGMADRLRRSPGLLPAAAPSGARGRDAVASIAAPREIGDLLVDPLGGLADLEARRIAEASESALAEDPLRMIRAIRLAATLPGFAIDEDLAGRIRDLAPRIRESASERISAEIEIILLTPRSGEAFRRMDSLGLLAPILPELDPLRGLKQPPRHHDHDVFEHTLRASGAADDLAAGCPSLGITPLPPADALILKWAALLHDAGKAATATVDGNGAPHFYGHEVVSARLAQDALRRLRVPARIVERVGALIHLHLRLGALSGAPAGDRPVRRIVREAGDLLDLLVLLSLADRRASGGEDPDQRESDLLAVARRALESREEVIAAANSPPLLDGREVMEILSLPPGRRVGSILRFIDRLRAEGRISSRDDAVALLKSLPPSRTRD